MRADEKIIRSVLIMLAIWCLSGPAAAGAGIRVSIADAQARPGGMVEVPVLVDGAQNVGSMDITIRYDPKALEFVSADKAGIFSGMISSSTDGAGRISLALIDSKGVTGSGQIAVLTFRATGNDGSKTPLSIASADAADATTVQPVAVTTSVGSVSIGTVRQSPGFPPLVSVMALGIVLAAAAGRKRCGQ